MKRNKKIFRLPVEAVAVEMLRKGIIIIIIVMDKKKYPRKSLLLKVLPQITCIGNV